MSRKEYIYTEEQVKELCTEWQERLKLNRWDIDIKICHSSKFNNEGSEGEVNYVLSSGQAIIHILDPEDYPDSPFPQDMERTIVHELLHLQFASFTVKDRESLEFDMMENTVELIAQTLVDLKREKRAK